MSERQATLFDDPDQFVPTGIPEGDQDKFLGNFNLTSRLFHDFAREAVLIYDDFLHAKKTSDVALRETTTLIHRYADIFSGRNRDYQLPDWMPDKLEGRLRAWYEIKTKTDVYVGYFCFLADQCHEAAKAMVQGMDEEEAGAKLAEIVDDGVGRFMFVIR